MRRITPGKRRRGKLVIASTIAVSPGLGDHLAAWLANHGIAPASYRRWKVRWGFTDACNCPERKEKLNRVGRWVSRVRKRVARQEKLNRFGRWVASLSR
jgi:hypothetical protein